MKPSVPPFGGRQATLMLPENTLTDLVRLAELTGHGLEAELVRVLRFYLDVASPGFWGRTDAALDTLFRLAHSDEAWRPVKAGALPAWAIAAIAEYAADFATTPSMALALMTRGTARTLLRAEIRALERRERLSEAFVNMLAEDQAA